MSGRSLWGLSTTIKMVLLIIGKKQTVFFVFLFSYLFLAFHVISCSHQEKGYCMSTRVRVKNLVITQTSFIGISSSSGSTFTTLIILEFVRMMLLNFLIFSSS